MCKSKLFLASTKQRKQTLIIYVHTTCTIVLIAEEVEYLGNLIEATCHSALRPHVRALDNVDAKIHDVHVFND